MRQARPRAREATRSEREERARHEERRVEEHAARAAFTIL